MANRGAKKLKESAEEMEREQIAQQLRRGKLRHKKSLDLIKHLCFAPMRGTQSYNSRFESPEDDEALRNLSGNHASLVHDYRGSKRDDKEQFWPFIETIAAKSSLVDAMGINIFWRMFSYNLFFQQDVATWTAKSSNDDKQYFSLVNHIFAKFPLPKFALNIWRDGHTSNNNHINWFFHLAEGKNIRAAEKLPFPLSPRMAHAFLAAPEDYSFEQAFLFGQLKSLGAEKRLIDELCGNLRTPDMAQNEFWTIFYKMLIANPFLDLVHAQPLRDFIIHQRTLNPNYSLKGRNPQTLLTQMEVWHQELNRARVERAREAARQRGQNAAQRVVDRTPFKPVSYKWKPSFPSVFEFKEGPKITWRIYELTTSEELTEEGSEMRHCVGSYASSCASKRSAILSMTKNGKKTATLEVSLSSNKVIQARGKCNRALDAKEQRLVMEWSQKNRVY